MKNIFFSLMLLTGVSANAQLFVSSNSDIYVSSSTTLYTAENFVNEGVLTLEASGTADVIFDGDYTNTNGIVNFNDNAFRIGSGEVGVSANDVNLEFATSGDVVESLIVNKTGGVATALSSTLKVTEDLTMIDGDLSAADEVILVSNSSNTAVVLESDPNANASVTVQRYFPGKRAFRFISPSVNSILPIHDNWQEGASAYNDTSIENGYGIHITGLGYLPSHSGTDPSQTDQIGGLDWQPTGNPSLFEYNNGSQNWEAVLDTDSRLLNAQIPLLTMVRGARVTGGVPLDITTNSTTGTETVLRAKGELLFGDESAPLSTGASEYSFVANPYHSQVDFNTLSSNGLTTFVYYWDPNINTRGGYVSWDTSTNLNSILNSGTGTSEINQYIQPGQAFFVQNASSLPVSPSLTFTETNKDNTSIQTEVFSNNPLSTLGINLKSEVNNELIINDGIIMIFDSTYSDSVNDEDALRFANEDETLAIVQDSNLLMFDKRPEPQNEQVVPLNIQNYRNLNYQFNFVKENTQVEVVLEDTYTGLITAIEDNTIYDYTIDDAIPESKDESRFNLIFNPTTLNLNDFENFGMTLSPNPTSAILNFQFTSNLTMSDSKVNIYDVTGRLVSIQNMSDSLSVNVSNLSDGMYLVKVTNNNKTWVSKFIKE